MSGERISSLFSTMSQGNAHDVPPRATWSGISIRQMVCMTLSQEEPEHRNSPLPMRTQRRGGMNGPLAFLFIATQVRLRRFTYILSWGRAEAEKWVARHSSTVPAANLSSPP